MKTIRCLVSTLLLMALLVACQPDQQEGWPSKESIEKTQKAAAEIRAALYAPPHSRLIAEKKDAGTNPDIYPGCTMVGYYLTYQSEDPFETILADYRENLKKGGWEPHPDYPHNANEDYWDKFQYSPQAVMEISTSVDEKLIPYQALLKKDRLYLVYFIYYDPLESDCSG